MFEQISTAWHFAADHALVLAAVLIAAGGVAIRLSGIPFAARLAALVWIVAAALGAFGEGYAIAKSGDRTAELRAQIAQMEKNETENADIVRRANARVEDAEAKRGTDNETIADLRADLARARNDHRPTDAQCRWLWSIGADVFPKPANPAARLRKAGRRSPVVTCRGSIAALADYRAALAEANRRLLHDRDFLNDLNGKMGASR